MTRTRPYRVRGSRAINNHAPVIHEIVEDPFENHRTCWMHLVAYMRDREMKLPNKELDRFKENAPCYYKYKGCTCGERSRRRIKGEYFVSKLRKKLDSETFAGYLEDLWKSFSDDKKVSFTYLDCLWFSMYRNANCRSRVLTWIKAKQIFSRKYVFVPIICWSHWNLLIFCNFGENLELETRKPCMLLLDSLQLADPRQLEPDIRKFVLDIYRNEGRTENLGLVSKIPLFVPQVPQQQNDVECGSFVLYYINLFLENAPENFSIDGYPYFMEKDWFGPEGLEDFRNKLDSLATIRKTAKPIGEAERAMAGKAGDFRRKQHPVWRIYGRRG